ncbi:uncharacterized [Tachysurus ichikawai]
MNSTTHPPPPVLTLRVIQVFQVRLDQKGKMEIQEMKASLDPWAPWVKQDNRVFKALKAHGDTLENQEARVYLDSREMKGLRDYLVPQDAMAQRVTVGILELQESAELPAYRVKTVPLALRVNLDFKVTVDNLDQRDV